MDLTEIEQKFPKYSGKYRSDFKDLTGQKFGRLTVLYRGETPGKRKEVYWVCQCECGNVIQTSRGCLISGDTRSCGCLQKDRTRQNQVTDKPGNKYGKLTLLSYNNDGTWLCECECGNKINVLTHSLHSGNTSSCGCILSKGEMYVLKILQELNIQHKPQYSFDDLIGLGGGKLKFDYGCKIQDKLLLIEYDGKQHFHLEVSGWNNIDKFNYTQTHDKLKNEYCLMHNIPLLRIHYSQDDYNKIKTIIINFLKENRLDDFITGN